MKQWWLNLAERERQVLLLGTISVFFALLYWGAWAPLQKNLQQSRGQVKQLQQQLDWMHQQAPRVHQLKQAEPISHVTHIDISSAITASSQTKKMALKRIQPQGDNAVVELDIVGFDQLVNWLDLLEQQYGITPQQIELQSLPLVGQVQVKRLLLGRKNKE
jgi:general secretion pathway protein M